MADSKLTDPQGGGTSSSDIPAKCKLPTLLEEAEECLAQSNLMFLLADLRLLSATGRIHTSFDTIAIDSDEISRTDAAMLAQRIQADMRQNRNFVPPCHGMFPAQIMAVLLIELRKEVKALKARQQLQQQPQGNPNPETPGGGRTIAEEDSSSDHSISSVEQGDSSLARTNVAEQQSLFSTWTSRKGRKQYEVDMHFSLKAYSDMIGKDLSSNRPEITRFQLMERMKSNYFKRHYEQESGALSMRLASKALPGKRAQLSRTQSVPAMKKIQQETLGSKSLHDPAKVNTPTNNSKRSSSDQGSISVEVKDVLINSMKTAAIEPDHGTEITLVEVNDQDCNQKHNLRFTDEDHFDVQDPLFSPNENTYLRHKSDPDVSAKDSPSPKRSILKPLTPISQSARSSTWSGQKSHSAQILTTQNSESMIISERNYPIEMELPKHEPKHHPFQTRPGSAIPARLEAYISHVRQNQRVRMQSVHDRVAERMAEVTGRVNEQLDRVQLSEEAINRHRLEKMVNDFFNVGVSVTTESGRLNKSLNRPLTEDELLDLMEKAVESRRRERIEFMASFFRDGTVSHLMAKSTSKVVWLNDWYPLKDPTYAISIDSEKKRVLVVFRGAITRADWGHSTDLFMKRTTNPIQDDYVGKKKHLKFHRGFYMYLFRRRKDTGTSKYDEIASKVEQYAKVIGEDYKIVVTGYSLGAALGTLFSFYASVEERFTKNAPVKFISFGGPYVGAFAFGDAFRYQEQKRKIMYARFHNERDIGEFLSWMSTLYSDCTYSKTFSIISFK